MRRRPGLDTLTPEEAAKWRAEFGKDAKCHSAMDGECFWRRCPQNRDGEPKKTGRHCPLERFEGMERER